RPRGHQDPRSRRRPRRARGPRPDPRRGPRPRREARAVGPPPADRRGDPRRLAERRRPPEGGRRADRAAGPRPDGGGVRVTALSAADVIIRPVISEKSIDVSTLTDRNPAVGNKYTFAVHRDANKIQIKEAIEELYAKEKVTVVS